MDDYVYDDESAAIRDMAYATEIYDGQPWCDECRGYGFGYVGFEFRRCSRGLEKGHGRAFPYAWYINWKEAS